MYDNNIILPNNDMNLSHPSCSVKDNICEGCKDETAPTAVCFPSIPTHPSTVMAMTPKPLVQHMKSDVFTFLFDQKNMW